MPTTVTVASFRLDFPEFGNTTTYPDRLIAFWMGLAVKQLPEDRWCDILDEGIELYTAHEVTLAGRNAAGNPGDVVAPTLAMAVDKVSITSDTKATELSDSGHWGGTSYGQQLLRLARMVGAGPVQFN